MKKYIHTYIHTYILACLIFGSSAYSINYQAIDHRPDFINLSPQKMSQDHRRQASLGQEKALVAASYINFNLKGLNIIKGDKGKFINVKNTQISGHKISLKLPGINAPVLLNVENVQNLIKGEEVVTYTGHVAENSNDFFTLSVSNDGVMAKVNYGKYIYIITPLQGSAHKHSIAQLEKSLMVKDTSEDFVANTDKSTNAKNHVEKSNNGSGHVRVLFYSATGVYWPSIYVSTIVSEMNAALARSGVSSNNYISSAGLKIVDSAFTGQCKGPILTKMINSTNEFNNINQDLITYGADIAVALVATYTNQDCGFGSEGIWGRIGGKSKILTPSDPFIVVADAYALGDLTVLHEFGHVFGGAHALLGPNEYSGVHNYARGFIHFDNQNPDNSWQTIMGGYGFQDDDCVFSGPYSPCERINYFSNPDPLISYNGLAIGAVDKNMKRSLNSSMPFASNWRGNPIPIPNIPNPISSNNEYCYGLNTINWTAQSSTTEYKLYKSTSSSFTSPVLLYTGSNTNTMVNVSSGTWYLRAQACNASGCSPYSNQVTATRYNGCL